MDAGNDLAASLAETAISDDTTAEFPVKSEGKEEKEQ
jgi:hypothetical protein